MHGRTHKVRGGTNRRGGTWVAGALPLLCPWLVQREGCAGWGRHVQVAYPSSAAQKGGARILQIVCAPLPLLLHHPCCKQSHGRGKGVSTTPGRSACKTLARPTFRMPPVHAVPHMGRCTHGTQKVGHAERPRVVLTCNAGGAQLPFSAPVHMSPSGPAPPHCMRMGAGQKGEGGGAFPCGPPSPRTQKKGGGLPCAGISVPY